MPRSSSGAALARIRRSRAWKTETDLCVGDVHPIGSALLQVCQPRQPWLQFALYFRDKRMPRAMVRSGRAGWYYRVLEPGDVGAGDEIELVDRPQPEFPFARLVAIVNHGHATPEENALAALPGLASWLRKLAQDSIELIGGGDECRR